MPVVDGWGQAEEGEGQEHGTQVLVFRRPSDPPVSWLLREYEVIGARYAQLGRQMNAAQHLDAHCVRVDGVSAARPLASYLSVLDVQARIHRVRDGAILDHRQATWLALSQLDYKRRTQ